MMPIAELKAFLRIETAEEDDVLQGFAASALGLCEAFIGQVIAARDEAVMLPVVREWQRLTLTPVRAIDSVIAIDAAGGETVIDAEDYRFDIDADGDGWLRLMRLGDARRVRVLCSVGMAEGWAAVPAPLAQGMIRLAAHLYIHRDAGDAHAPPAAVTALWRPWRRMAMGAVPSLCMGAH